MDTQGIHVMTIANSIIGVSILAMPYCFKQCGILLSILMLIVSSIISRLACHFLLKSAIKARLRTFEFLAYHAFGPLGKFVIEIGMIGFLLGTCIAFFVVMGDLGPQIVAHLVGIKTTSTVRTSILVILAVFCILPLGLLRNVDSLSGVCTATIGFYICLVLKIMGESAPHILNGDWYDRVEFWRSDGVLQCIPIFSMALFCQTQLFEIYQAIPNASLDRMNNLIRVAVNICTSVYIFVGIFGYIALSNESFSGNVLMSFKPSFMTEIMKVGFVLSVAFSFPLIVFPCRASLFSLLYKPTYVLHDSGTNYIPEGKFRLLTVLIVFVSLVIGVLIPNIELVLGLVGSTIGVMICVLFPATCFICMSTKNTNERILAQIMLFVGIIVMVLGTYANLYAIEEANLNPEIDKIEVVPLEIDMNALKNVVEHKDVVLDIPTTLKSRLLPEVIENNSVLKLEKIEKPLEEAKVLKEVRHEPPQPVEPEEVAVENLKEIPEAEKPVQIDNVEETIRDTKLKSSSKEEQLKSKEEYKLPDTIMDINRIPNSDNQNFENEIKNVLPEAVKEPTKVKEASVQNMKNPGKEIAEIIGSIHSEQVDIEAIRKEDKEIIQQEKDENKEFEDNKLNLIDQLQKQRKIVEEQKKLLEEIKQKDALLKEEKLKAVKEIETIAKQAIKSLVDDDIVSVQENPNDVNKKPSFLKVNADLPQVNVNSEKSAAKLEPLSYQLGLNFLNTSSSSAQQPAKSIHFDNIIPIPIAKSNNLSVFSSINMKLNDTLKPLEIVLDDASNRVGLNIVSKQQNLVPRNEVNVEVTKSSDAIGMKDADTQPIDIIDLKLKSAVRKEVLTEAKSSKVVVLDEKLKLINNNALTNDDRKIKDISLVKKDFSENDDDKNKRNQKEAVGLTKTVTKSDSLVVKESEHQDEIQAMRRDILSKEEALNREKREAYTSAETCDKLQVSLENDKDESRNIMNADTPQETNNEYLANKVSEVTITPVKTEDKIIILSNLNKDETKQESEIKVAEQCEKETSLERLSDDGSLLKLFDKVAEEKQLSLNLDSLKPNQYLDSSKNILDTSFSIFKTRKR